MRMQVMLTAFAMAIVAAGPVAAQDAAKKGETVFKRTCAACHTVEPGKNKVGPSLAGVIGRHAGSIQGFNYSQAMKKADVTWTEENIDKYLANPKEFIPGNRMAFPGIKKDDEREAVIEYLESVKAGT